MEFPVDSDQTAVHPQITHWGEVFIHTPTPNINLLCYFFVATFSLAFEEREEVVTRGRSYLKINSFITAYTADILYWLCNTDQQNPPWLRPVICCVHNIGRIKYSILVLCIRHMRCGRIF